MRNGDTMPTRPSTGAIGSFEAFAQIHLGSAEERAVYRCFARDAEGCRSDAEVALEADLDPATATWVLERFRDAGLIERVDGNRYRWRPSHRYALRRGEPNGGMRDPVCGMRVGIDARHHAEDLFGHTEYFCSERCLAAFLAWPSAFTRRPDRPARRPSTERRGAP